jgi:hypothetical protein
MVENSVFWDAITVVSRNMPSGTLYGVAIARSDVSENVMYPSTAVLKLIVFHTTAGVCQTKACHIISISKYHT